MTNQKQLEQLGAASVEQAGGQSSQDLNDKKDNTIDEPRSNTRTAIYSLPAAQNGVVATELSQIRTILHREEPKTKDYRDLAARVARYEGGTELQNIALEYVLAAISDWPPSLRVCEYYILNGQPEVETIKARLIELRLCTELNIIQEVQPRLIEDLRMLSETERQKITKLSLRNRTDRSNQEADDDMLMQLVALLPNLNELDVSSWPINGSCLHRLLTHFTNINSVLSKLHLAHAPIGNQGLAAIVQSPSLESLKSLKLNNCEITNWERLDQLTTTHLESLYIADETLTNDNLQIICANNQFPCLTDLRIHNSQSAGEDLLITMMVSGNFPVLKRLNMWDSVGSPLSRDLDADQTKKLRTGLAQLDTLHLCITSFTSGILVEVANNCTNLTWLFLEQRNGIGNTLEAMTAFNHLGPVIANGNLSSLISLTLSSSGIGVKGLAAILNSDKLPKLKHVDTDIKEIPPIAMEALLGTVPDLSKLNSEVEITSVSMAQVFAAHPSFNTLSNHKPSIIIRPYTFAEETIDKIVKIISESEALSPQVKASMLETISARYDVGCSFFPD